MAYKLLKKLDLFTEQSPKRSGGCGCDPYCPRNVRSSSRDFDPLAIQTEREQGTQCTTISGNFLFRVFHVNVRRLIDIGKLTNNE